MGAQFPRTPISLELLEWECILSGFGGSENSGRERFKNGEIFTSLSLISVSVYFRMT